MIGTDTASPSASKGATVNIDTRRAPRRHLRFTCLGCLRSELDAIDAAHRAGSLRTTGNWNAAQILDHCAILLEMGLDGSTMRAPLVARIFGRIFKPMMLKPNSMRPGFKLPEGASALLPRPGVTYEDAMARIRGDLARLEAGERMTHPSPWLGPLTHEEWLRINLNHTQMHMGFIDR